MRRPFATRYSPNAPAGVMTATIRFKAAVDGDGAAIIDAARDKFSDLAKSGALCGNQIQPDQSSVGPSRTSFPDSMTALWTFSELRVDPFSLTVLVNIVEYIHEKFLPVSDLEVKWSQIERIPDPSRDDFPQPHEPLPFEFSYDDTLPAFEIVLDFEVAHDLEQVEEIEGIVGAWFSGTNLGGYGDESSRPAITQINFSPEVSTVTEDSIVWYIDRFACGSQAIDGLVNVVGKIHRRYARVRSLEIGE